MMLRGWEGFHHKSARTRSKCVVTTPHIQICFDLMQ